MSILSSIRQLFKSPFDDRDAHALYVAIVKQARLPEFYDSFGVQDTPEGRFDMVAVHCYLVIRRLRDDQGRTSELAQALFDIMFADLDQNLREMSYGDTGVAKRIKKMAEGFYGRVKAYDAGMDEGGNTSVLEQALDRNLYRDTPVTPEQLAAMSGYVRIQAANLATQDLNDMMAGKVSFSPPPPQVSRNQEN